MRIIYADLPPTIKAVTVLEDDYYNIIVNQNISYEAQRLAIKHELEHIKNNDFYSPSCDMIEAVRHGY